MPNDAAAMMDVEDTLEPFPRMVLRGERPTLGLVAGMLEARKGDVPLTRNPLEWARFRPISHGAHEKLTPGAQCSAANDVPTYDGAAIYVNVARTFMHTTGMGGPR